MCRCRRQQMHIVETLFLNPFEKWVFYGRFPCKFVVHLILSVVVTAQAVIYFQRDIQHVSRTNQHFVHMFTSPDPLHSPYALQEGVAALITNHFLINNRSIVRYQLQHPDQMTLYLGYRNDERGEVKVNASQWISSEVLLRAAAELGVHYADTSDEFYWQRWMIDRYNQRAQDSGAKMVLSSGFCVLVLSSGFCVLAGDLGAQLALRDLSDVGGDLRLDAWLEGYNGGVSAGVIHTAEAMKKAKFPKEWETDPYVLAPNASAELRKDSKVEGMRYPSWVSGEGLMVSNIFGPYDARLLRRSFVHLKQAVTLRVGATSGMYPKWAAFIAEHPGSWSKLTQCPTDSVYKDGSWSYRFRAMAASGAASGGAASRVSQVLLSGHGDPGYHFTALGLAETGLCLAGKTPGCLKQNTPGGVYTPMSALEPDVLTARLESIDLLKVEKPKATVGVTQVII